MNYSVVKYCLIKLFVIDTIDTVDSHTCPLFLNLKHRREHMRLYKNENN